MVASSRMIVLLCLPAVLLVAGCRKPPAPDPRSKDPVVLAIHGAPGARELCEVRSRIEAAAAGDQSISGVEVSGQGERRLVIAFDPERLTQFVIGIADAERALVTSLDLDRKTVRSEGSEITIALDECQEIPFEMQDLQNVRVEDPQGSEVPLSALADVRLEAGEKGFEHAGGPALRVVVDPASPTTPETIESLVRGWLEGTGILVDVLEDARDDRKRP